MLSGSTRVFGLNLSASGLGVSSVWMNNVRRLPMLKGFEARWTFLVRSVGLVDALDTLTGVREVV